MEDIPAKGVKLDLNSSVMSEPKILNIENGPLNMGTGNNS
jgi:hypothetical protein